MGYHWSGRYVKTTDIENDKISPCWTVFLGCCTKALNNSTIISECKLQVNVLPCFFFPVSYCSLKAMQISLLFISIFIGKWCKKWHVAEEQPYKTKKEDPMIHRSNIKARVITLLLFWFNKDLVIMLKGTLACVVEEEFASISGCLKWFPFY